MLLFSSALTYHRLTFTRLSENMEYFDTAVQWATDAWGYLGDIHERAVFSIRDHIYIGLFADQPVAMFGFLPHHSVPRAGELVNVYVMKECRGFGFGRQLIAKAKEVAAESGADLILLGTLKPSLNRLYEKFGATVVCERQVFSQPTDYLMMPAP